MGGHARRCHKELRSFQIVAFPAMDDHLHRFMLFLSACSDEQLVAFPSQSDIQFSDIMVSITGKTTKLLSVFPARRICSLCARNRPDAVTRNNGDLLRSNRIAKHPSKDGEC